MTVNLLSGVNRRRRPAPYALPGARPWNAVMPLQVPTPDGTGSVIHTSVLDFGAYPFAGYRYWLTATPYHNNQVELENPCVWASHDEYHWEEPAEGLNPVFPTPDGAAYNSDVDIAHDPDTGLLHLWWRTCLDRPANLADGTAWVELRHSTSPDGVTWAPYDTPISFQNVTVIERVISPSVVRVNAGLWYMYTLEAPGALWRRAATTPAGPWGEPERLIFPEGTGNDQWHLEVILDSTGVYRMLVATGPGNMWAASSRDGLTWRRAPGFVMEGRAGQWDSGLYRSTFTEHENGRDYRVWYSARLRVGYTVIPKSEWPTPPT